MVLEVMDKKTFEYKHQLTKMMTCLVPAAFLTLIMLGYDCYAISTNFSEVSSNLAQADEVGGAQVAMGVLAILAMLALLLCYCLFEPTETAINRGKVQHHRIVFGLANSLHASRTKFLLVALICGAVASLVLFVSVILRIIHLANGYGIGDPMQYGNVNASDEVTAVSKLLWYLWPMTTFVCGFISLVCAILFTFFAFTYHKILKGQ